MPRLFFLIFLFFPASSRPTDLHHQEVVLSCLKTYQPSFVVFFTCWSRQDKVKMHEMILRENLDVRVVFAKAERDFLTRINTRKYEHFSYFLDMGCEGAGRVLKEASVLDRFGKFQFLYSWYLLGVDAEQNMSAIVDIFRKFKTRMDMDVKVFEPSGNQSFNVQEIFNPGINAGLRLRTLGTFTDGRLILKSSTSYYESRKNMSGVLIRSANVIRYPFKTSFHKYMTDLKLRNFDIYSKFHYQLFLVLREIHGFSYNTTLPPSWFGNTSSGEDGGIAKMLWDDTVDISSAGCILRLLGNERMDFYDFIVPYYKFRSCFYFRNPGVVKPNFNEVLKPFARTSWLATLYVTAIVCVCIEIAYFVEKRNENTRDGAWLKSVFVVIAVFSQQGLDTIPAHLAGRIILLHLLVCSILLYNYYTSSLVSSLISTEPEVLKTIEELLESTLRVGIELQPYTITYMLDRSKTDHNLFLLNRSKIFEHGQPNFLTVDDGVQKVHTGGFAYHTESITAYPLIAQTFEQDAICDLAEIVLINSDTSLMAQKKGQYKKLFQVSLRKMWTSGIMQKLHKTWVGSKPECLSSARVISVGINDLFLPYFLLAMGVWASLVILAVEVTWRKIRQRYDKQNNNDIPYLH